MSLVDKILAAPGKVGDVIEKGWAANLAQIKDYSKEEALGVAQMVDILTEPLKAPGKIYDQILNQLQSEAALRTKINEETGLTGKLSEDIRRSITNAQPSLMRLGYGMEKLSGYYTTMIEKSGRWNIQNTEALIRSAEVSRAFVGDLSKMAEFQANIEKIGLGATDAAFEIEKAGLSSTTLGLRAKKTTDDINKNILKLNSYGFKDGIQGLTKMSQIATEFRMDMEETFKVADKVFSPEGAVELSANLQVIGGILGDFNDPLKLMYMATNNVEGLQTALLDAASSLATYNDEQGRFEITGINLRRAKAMAQELGISYDELAKGAIASAERVQASSALMARGLQMSDEDREFMTNIAQMEGGQMVIKIPEELAKTIGEPTTVALSSMTDKLAQELIQNREDFKKQDSMSIAMDQLTLTEQIDRNVMAIASAAKVQLSRELKNTFETLGLEQKMELIAGNLDMKASELGDLEKLGVIKNMGDYVQKLKGWIESKDPNGKLRAREDIEEKLKLVKDAQIAERKEKVLEIRHIHQYNASPTLLDNMGRFIARSPETWEEMYSSNMPEEKSFLYSERY